MMWFLFFLAGSVSASVGQEVPGVRTTDAQLVRTGPQDQAYIPLDDFVAGMMTQWSIPGGVIAVSRQGQLVHWQGLGYSDRDRKIAAERETLFRVASVSKPITAVAVLHLAERGKLRLDATVADVLPELAREAVDKNVARVTVRQLLQHSAGWDDDDHDDVALRNDIRRLARQAGTTGHVIPLDLVRQRFKRPLDFVPGTDYAYSNFGYVVLGRILETVSGKPYGELVRDILMDTTGRDCRMLIGSPVLSGLDTQESRYYDFTGAPQVESVLSPGVAVAWPDGGIATTVLDSALGWVATAPSLAMFADRTFASMDGRSGLLSETTLREMTLRPPAPLWVGTEVYYGLGWRVKPINGGQYLWHGGSMPGTTSLLVHHPDGTSAAVLLNSRPQRWDEFNRALQDGVEHFLTSNIMS